MYDFLKNVKYAEDKHITLKQVNANTSFLINNSYLLRIYSLIFCCSTIRNFCILLNSKFIP